MGARLLPARGRAEILFRAARRRGRSPSSALAGGDLERPRRRQPRQHGAVGVAQRDRDALARRHDREAHLAAALRTARGATAAATRRDARLRRGSVRRGSRRAAG